MMSFRKTLFLQKNSLNTNDSDVPETQSCRKFTHPEIFLIQFKSDLLSFWSVCGAWPCVSRHLCSLLVSAVAFVEVFHITRLGLMPRGIIHRRLLDPRISSETADYGFIFLPHFLDIGSWHSVRSAGEVLASKVGRLTIGRHLCSKLVEQGASTAIAVVWPRGKACSFLLYDFSFFHW